MEGTRALSFVSSASPFSTSRSNRPLAYDKSPPQFFYLLASNSNAPSPLKSSKKPHKRTERNPILTTQKLNSEVSPHRAVSAVRLLRIEQGGAFADLLNEKCGGNGEGEMGYVQRTLGFRTRALDDRDIRLVTDIVGGTVRWRRYLDHLIMSLCVEERMFREMEPLLLQILRVGFYEIIKLNMPSYAVVDENVKLAKAALRPGAGNLVNAIMRKLLLLKETESLPLPVVEGDDRSRARALAIIHSHPVKTGWSLNFRSTGKTGHLAIKRWTASL